MHFLSITMLFIDFSYEIDNLGSVSTGRENFWFGGGDFECLHKIPVLETLNIFEKIPMLETVNFYEKIPHWKL